MNTKKAGRPKGEPTTLINFRIKTTTRQTIKRLYGRGLNRLFNNWINELIKKAQEESKPK